MKQFQLFDDYFSAKQTPCAWSLIMALSTRDALNMTPDDYVEMLQNLGMWDLQKPHTHRGYIYMSKRDPVSYDNL